MDTEIRFQLQPSSSTKALEMLIGTGLDRVHMTNLLSGTEPAGPEAHGTRMLHVLEILLMIGGGLRHPPVGAEWQPVRAHGA